MALRAQNEVMRHYDDQLLKTVYWSLGVTATIALLLVGFGWYANFKVYERDKIALRDELLLHASTEFRRLDAEYRASVAEQTQRLTEVAQNAARSATGDLEIALGDLRKAIGRLGDWDLPRIWYELYGIQAAKWRDSRIWTNALRCDRRMLEIALRTENEYRGADMLDAIRQDLVAGANPDADDISAINSLLGKLPKAHDVTVDALRELLKRSAAPPRRS